MSELVNKDQEILDEYYINGYNGVKAVLSVFPDMQYNVAAVRFNKIKNSQRNQDYISEKQARLKSQTEVSNERILKELLNWLYVDATDFMELSPKEIKELPAEVRRCIQSYKAKEQYDKHGNHIGTTVEVRLIDKTKAIEAINKHVGFYAQDNDQKANKVNILNVLKSADPSALNNLLQAMEDNKD
jgi:phage terminase small subunit